MTLRGIWMGIRRAAIVMPDHGRDDRHQDGQERQHARAALTTPLRMNWSSWSAPGQSRSRIEKVMSRLIPLPMPRSVICSPSHMTKMAPVVSVTTMMSRDAKPGRRRPRRGSTR